MREKHDPITNLSKVIVENKLAKAEDLKKIDAEVKKIVTEAADFALTDSEPAPEELYTDVLAEA